MTKHVCLEYQLNASQKKFTQPLVVMVETFRMSPLYNTVIQMILYYQHVNIILKLNYF